MRQHRKFDKRREHMISEHSKNPSVTISPITLLNFLMFDYQYYTPFLREVLVNTNAIVEFEE